MLINKQYMKTTQSTVKLTAFLIAIIFLQLTAFGQIKSDEKIPIDPAIKTGALPNGLRYYIRKNTRPEKKVELRLVVNAGSVLEDPDQLGLAHFTEHMAFNGTTHFAKNDLVQYLQSIGVR